MGVGGTDFKALFECHNAFQLIQSDALDDTAAADARCVYPLKWKKVLVTLLSFVGVSP